LVCDRRRLFFLSENIFVGEKYVQRESGVQNGVGALNRKNSLEKKLEDHGGLKEKQENSY